MDKPSYAESAVARLLMSHGPLFAEIRTPAIKARLGDQVDVLDLLKARTEEVTRLGAQIVRDQPAAIDHAITLIARWITQRAVVRVIGSPRARLAAAVPARRLSAGGADVYMQDGLLPVPHSLRGGGVIALAFWPETSTVLELLARMRKQNRDIQVLGFGPASSDWLMEFSQVYIRLPEVSTSEKDRALNQHIEEHVIAQILDSLILFAGRELGYTQTSWRIGNEELDATEPVKQSSS